MSSFLDSMHQIDGFQTTDSFRFGRNLSSSSTSLSSSSGYGSRLSLSHTDHSSTHRRISLTKYFKEKLSRHKSLASLLPFSPARTEPRVDQNADIYDNVWNLEKQIEELRASVQKQIPLDCHSIISMSVDTPKSIHHRIDDYDLLSVASWYQEGLSEDICDEYLNSNDQPTGSFLIRCNYTSLPYPFILSIKTSLTSIEHFFIQRTMDDHSYRIYNSSKRFINLSTLVIHHTVLHENLPVTLVLSRTHSTLNSPQQQRRQPSFGLIRSVRF